MPPKSKMTVTVQPARHRPTSKERRAAQVEAVANHQADLKREAAERRAKRAAADAAVDGSAPAKSGKPAAPRQPAAD
jgi:hypothetical protein